jgi:hypothetical protein
MIQMKLFLVCFTRKTRNSYIWNFPLQAE